MVNIGLKKALVNALIAPAHQHHLPRGLRGETADISVGKTLACGRKRNHGAAVAGRADIFQCFCKRLSHHHHAGAAPEGPVIDRPVNVLGDVSGVPEVNVPKAPLHRAGTDPVVGDRGKDLGKKRNNVNTHGG